MADLHIPGVGVVSLGTGKSYHLPGAGVISEPPAAVGGATIPRGFKQTNIFRHMIGR